MGVHYIADLSGCQRNFIEPEPARELALSIVARAGMTPIGEVTAHVTNGIDAGATVVIVVVPLKESHLSIHTWPEFGYAAIDLFTCGAPVKGRQAFDALCNWFSAKYDRRAEIPRMAEVE